MSKFDLQLFADDAESAPETTETQAEATPVAPPASEVVPDANESGNLGTTQPPQTPSTFTQEQVNQIVEQRLARERRAWERRLQELQQQFQSQVLQQQTTPPPNPQELSKQFLAEFSRDPLGALRKFAQTLTAEQAQQVQLAMQRTQMAAREALDRMQERYPDWQQQSGAVMQYIQSNPALNTILQQKGAELTPEVYEGVLEAAYSAVKARQLQTSAAPQVPGDVQAKMRAAAPVQKAARSQPAKSAEDVLFEAMMATRPPI